MSRIHPNKPPVADRSEAQLDLRVSVPTVVGETEPAAEVSVPRSKPPNQRFGPFRLIAEVVQALFMLVGETRSDFVKAGRLDLAMWTFLTGMVVFCTVFAISVFMLSMIHVPWPH
jgi:hypothetical protein